MQSSCDVLILTARFGTGHVSVSNALKEHVLAADSSLHIEVADMHEVMHPLGHKGIYRSYEMMVKHLPSLYNRYYYGKEKFPQLQKMDTASHASLKKLALYIEEKAPKIVISTFPLCTGYMSKYKEAYNSSIPLITCITDVVDSDEWLYPENDLYFVADECIREALIYKGYSADTLFPTGIPIRGMFVKPRDPQIRSQLGFAESDQIVLMMGGGLGLFPKEDLFYKWLGAIKNIKVIVLAGKNKQLYDTLMENNFPNFLIVQQTDLVSEYMKCADVLIGKSGGITLFEAIASILPMIIYKPRLGQELKNCQFIIEKEIGIVVEELEPLKEAVLTLLEDSETRRNLVNHLERLSKKIDMSFMGEKIVEVYYGAIRNNP